MKHVRIVNSLSLALSLLLVLFVSMSAVASGELDDPNPISLLTPADGSMFTSTTMTFTWEEAIDPDGDTMDYIFILAEDSPLNEVFRDTTGGTSYTLNNLECCIDYYWTVAVHNVDQDINYGAVDPAFSFTVHPGKTFYDGWSLMSLPEEPYNPLYEDVLGDDIDGLYQVIGFTAATGYYFPDEMELGEAYWLAIAHDTIASVDVYGDCLENDYTRNLDWGWNMFGYPFKNQSLVADWVFTFEGQDYSAQDAADSLWIVPTLYVTMPPDNEDEIPFFVTDTGRPWYGFWFLTMVEGITVTIPDPQAPVLNNDASELDENISVNQWDLPVLVRNEERTFTRLDLGVNESASPAFDALYDYPHSPEAPEGNDLDAYFFESDWLPDIDNRFISDIRSPYTEGTGEWAIQLTGTGTVELSWPEPVDYLPEGFEAELVDGNTVIEMAEATNYPVTIVGNHEVIVRITAQSTDVAESADLLPAEIQIESIYPNPFNPTTTVAFALNTSTGVKISLVNVSGQKVIEVTQGWFSAGHHKITLNADQLPSGIYFLNMEAGSRQFVRKISLIK